MARLTALLFCASIFGGLHLGVELYRAAVYGRDLAWQTVVPETLVVCAAGAAGYTSGAVLVGRGFQSRTIVYIALLGYFVSYSITGLLQSISVSPWIFVISLFVVTLLVALGIGPRWENKA